MRESKPASGWIEGEQSRIDYVQELTQRGATMANGGVRTCRAAVWDPYHLRRALRGAMSRGQAVWGR